MALNSPACVNDVIDGCLATGEGTTEKMAIVPARNRTRDLRNAGRMLL